MVDLGLHKEAKRTVGVKTSCAGLRQGVGCSLFGLCQRRLEGSCKEEL